MLAPTGPVTARASPPLLPTVGREQKVHGGVVGLSFAGKVGVNHLPNGSGPVREPPQLCLHLGARARAVSIVSKVRRGFGPKTARGAWLIQRSLQCASQFLVIKCKSESHHQVVTCGLQLTCQPEHVTSFCSF